MSNVAPASDPAVTAADPASLPECRDRFDVLAAAVADAMAEPAIPSSLSEVTGAQATLSFPLLQAARALVDLLKLSLDKHEAHLVDHDARIAALEAR